MASESFAELFADAMSQHLEAVERFKSPRGDTVSLLGRLPARPFGLSRELPHAYKWVVDRSAERSYLKGGKAIRF